jgi:hypothetical protein
MVASRVEMDYFFAWISKGMFLGVFIRFDFCGGRLKILEIFIAVDKFHCCPEISFLQ